MQMFAYAAAPVVEARTERPAKPSHFESAQAPNCAPAHQPATCMACQLLNVAARRSEPRNPLTGGDERAAIVVRATTSLTSRAPPLPYLGRAPPTSLA